MLAIVWTIAAGCFWLTGVEQHGMSDDTVKLALTRAAIGVANPDPLSIRSVPQPESLTRSDQFNQGERT